MALEIVFWAAVGLIVYAHLGYPLLLWGLARVFGEDSESPEPDGERQQPEECRDAERERQDSTRVERPLVGHGYANRRPRGR